MSLWSQPIFRFLPLFLGQRHTTNHLLPTYLCGNQFCGDFSQVYKQYHWVQSVVQYVVQYVVWNQTDLIEGVWETCWGGLDLIIMRGAASWLLHPSSSHSSPGNQRTSDVYFPSQQSAVTSGVWLSDVIDLSEAWIPAASVYFCQSSMLFSTFS